MRTGTALSLCWHSFRLRFEYFLVSHRLASMERFARAESMNITISLFVITTVRCFIRGGRTTRGLESLWKRQLPVMNVCRDSSLKGKRLWFSWLNWLASSFSFVDCFPTAICNVPFTQSYAGSCFGLKIGRSNRRNSPYFTGCMLWASSIERSKWYNVQFSWERWPILTCGLQSSRYCGGIDFASATRAVVTSTSPFRRWETLLFKDHVLQFSYRSKIYGWREN